MSAPRDRLALGLTAALAAFLLLGNLGAPVLWEDEAETALLARNTLRFGWPRATGGAEGVVSQQCGADVEPGTGRWTRHPWGPMYLTAASFALLGDSPFAARLPHALLALACVPATCLLGRRFGLKGRAAWLPPLLLVLSIAFVPYGRQCRYHAMAILGGALALASLPGVSGPRWKRDGALLAAALLLLLESSYLLFAAAFAGLALASPILLRDPPSRKRVAALLLLVALAALPLLGAQGFFAGLATQAGQAGNPAAKLWAYLLKLDLFFLPFSVLLFTALATLLRPAHRPPVLPDGGRVAAFLAAFVLVNLAVLSASTVAFSRYLAHLLPAFAFLTALALLAVRRVSPPAAALLGILLVGSGFLHGWLARLLPPPGLAAQRLFPCPLLLSVADALEPPERRHGPLTDTLRALLDKASTGDSVLITSGDLPLRYHTRLRVLGGESGQDLRGLPPPDWVVWREFFRMRPRTPAAAEDQRRMREFLASLPWERYAPMPHPPQDTVWDGNPDPEARLRLPPPCGPSVAIFRRAANGR